MLQKHKEHTETYSHSAPHNLNAALLPLTGYTLISMNSSSEKNSFWCPLKFGIAAIFSVNEFLHSTS